MPQELLRLENVTRRITSEFYIRGASLIIYKGEVLALAGKNAAGKSTFSGVINGVLPAESGRIFFEGQEVAIKDTIKATELGIITLMQNNRGFAELSTADNILFGNPKYYKSGSLTPRKMREVCLKCFEALGIELDPLAHFGTLTPAQKQMAAIARAYLFDAKLIIMDEPSSHLPENECEVLYKAVQSLRSAQVSVLYITHRLNEIIKLADRVAFIERGEIKKVQSAEGLTELDLIEGIEGYRVTDIYSKLPVELGDPVLELDNICGGCAENISLTLRRGEVVSILSGVGQCGVAICHVLLGLVKYSGTIKVCGKVANLQNPLVSNALRIAAAVDEKTEQQLENYDSEGGKKTGALAVLMANIKHNTSGMGRMLSNVLGMDSMRQREYMTGGFKQKELVARAMARDADIYLLVNATNGIDLQAKMGIYKNINDLAKRGCGVLYFTNDATEAVGIADRVIVLGENTVVFDTYAKETDTDTLVKLLKM